MARLLGGPKIEFICGRLATIFGFAGSVPISTIVPILRIGLTAGVAQVPKWD